MDTSRYKVIITPTAFKEINKIYNYITEELHAENAAKALMKKIEKEVQMLKYAPKIHKQIKKVDELKRTYKRIVINNYILLYTIYEDEKLIFVSHMYYGGSNYMNNYFL